MEVIAIVSRKGGVGKTATVYALGAGLLRKGHSVLFVDLDSQTNLSKGLRASVDGPGSMDVLTGDVPVQEAIQHAPQGDIMAATEDLAAADAIIKGSRKEYRLKDALDGLQYDYVVIDTPAALGALTINALTAADCAIIPVQADTDSLDGLRQTNKTIEAVKKYSNPGLYIDGILITRYSARAILSRDMKSNFEDAAKLLHTRVYSTPIRENIAIKEAKDSQQDIFSYSPRSNGAKDYAKLINEFLKGKNT